MSCFRKWIGKGVVCWEDPWENSEAPGHERKMRPPASEASRKFQVLENNFGKLLLVYSEAPPLKALGAMSPGTIYPLAHLFAALGEGIGKRCLMTQHWRKDSQAQHIGRRNYGCAANVTNRQMTKGFRQNSTQESCKLYWNTVLIWEECQLWAYKGIRCFYKTL